MEEVKILATQVQWLLWRKSKRTGIRTRWWTVQGKPGGGGYGGAGARSTLASGRPYGDGRITNLIGGSGSGGYLIGSSGGSGGGALSIGAVGTLELDSPLYAIGGTGATGSSGGSGGSVKLSASN